MKNIGSKKFILIALVIFVILVIAGIILDRMAREEAAAPPQGRNICCIYCAQFLDDWRNSV